MKINCHAILMTTITSCISELDWKPTSFAMKSRLSKAFDALDHKVQIYNSLVQGVHPQTANHLYIPERDIYTLVWARLQEHKLDIEINRRLQPPLRDPIS